jgi:hypothetical protein
MDFQPQIVNRDMMDHCWINAPMSIDILCLAGSAWDGRFDRPHHLMNQAARTHRVWYFEPPQLHGGTAELLLTEIHHQLFIVTPLVPLGTHRDDEIRVQRRLLNQLLSQHQIHQFVCWHFTVESFACSDHLKPRARVFDCLEFLAAHSNNHESLALQQRLLRNCDLIFAAGSALYEKLRSLHPAVYFTSNGNESIPISQTLSDRRVHEFPTDIRCIRSPRIGYFGPIDRRIDLSLLRHATKAHPELSFVFIGEYDSNQCELPDLPNVHYLGDKKQLRYPQYLSGIEVGFAPYELAAEDRFSDPLMPAEMINFGIPVVGTPTRYLCQGELPDSFVYLVRDHASLERQFNEAIRHPKSNHASRRPLRGSAPIRTWIHSFDDAWSLILDASTTGRELPHRHRRTSEESWGSGRYIAARHTYH